MTKSPSDERQDFFFIQMADPQFGIFAALSGKSQADIDRIKKLRLIVRPAPKTTGFAAETELYEKAIAAANRLVPEFIVMCGDMVQDDSDPAQYAELMRISSRLRDDTPIRWVCGNHDIGNLLTWDSLGRYRERHGDDNYHFDHLGSRFVVLNSNVACDPSRVAGEWERQLEFLESTLREAQEIGRAHVLVFTHHPLFIDHADEDDTLLVIPRERRLVLLELLHAYKVSAVFSGHWHRNNYAYDGDLLMVTSAAVGYPLGDDPSGFRVVKVFEDRIEHEYIPFDRVPESVDMQEMTASAERWPPA